ncbi:MAG: protein translocase subunit SecF [Ruminococcaceae bacterium]|nr:protein translocase subunit SecF [Oscillospiraceae bacterium]
MREFNINYNKTFKPALIIYLAIFIIGAVCAGIFGVNLDINFSGGTKISYSYTGEIKDADVEKAVKENINKSFKITKSTSLAGDTQTFEIALVGKDAVSAEVQEKLTNNLQTKFKDNEISLYNSNSVSPTVAGAFFIKSLVAVLITAVLVVIYVGFRFRKIGGVSAALTALCALVFDILITFVTCVVFRLQIDSNYIAVILTILGYSLNDTIVIYDRIRENERIYRNLEIGELVNKSVNKVMIRNIVTTITTITAVVTIVVVAEFFGLTTLRTFAIPMAFGLVSGSISSIFISGPLWVIWKRYKAKKKANAR